MSVVAPPPQDELELLIREARARQRKRWLLIGGVIAAVGVGIGLWAALTGGVSTVIRGHGPVSAAVGHVSASGSIRMGIEEVGTSGGMTWASGGQRLWLTPDAGRTWRTVRLRPLGCGLHKGNCHPLASLGDVQFVDRQRGWISSTDRAGIYRTTDGGRTWRVSVLPGCARGCDGASISFLDPRRGYALAFVRWGDGPRLFRTDDGGKTWRLVSEPPVGYPIGFVDEKDGFGFGAGPPVGPYKISSTVLYRTTDGGRTWSRDEIGGPEAFGQLPTIASLGRHVVLVQNGSYSSDPRVSQRPGSVWASGDGGRKWNGIAVPAGVGVHSSFSAVSPRSWMFASGRSVYVTQDAGHSWRRFLLRGLPPRTFFERIAFSSPRLGWLIVPRSLASVRGASTLLRTTDGGRHWTVSGPLAPKRHRHD